MILNNYLILLFGLILILALIFLFFYMKKVNYESLENRIIEEESKFTSKNPLYNVLNSDYKDNPNKKKLLLEYDTNVEESINNSVKKSIMEINKDNNEIGKIFKNLTNNIDFENSMRQFYTNSTTTIPNTQDDFLKYCYGSLPSDKPLKIH